MCSLDTANMYGWRNSNKYRRVYEGSKVLYALIKCAFISSLILLPLSSLSLPLCFFSLHPLFSGAHCCPPGIVLNASSCYPPKFQNSQAPVVLLLLISSCCCVVCNISCCCVQYFELLCAALGGVCFHSLALTHVGLVHKHARRYMIS